MAADYPAAITSFSTLVDGVTEVTAPHHNDVAAEIVAIQTELGTDPAGTVATVKVRLAQSMDGKGNIDFITSTELTIASDSITPTQNWHNVDTQADAASDDLSTIVASGVTDGFLLVIRPNNDARTVVVKHNVGNILCASGGDFTLDDQRDLCVLIYDATLTKWIAIVSGVDTSSFLTASSTNTLTNKRRQPRVFSTTSTSTLTPEIDTYDEFVLTALAANLTVANHSTSTPASGEKIIISIVPDATPRTLTFGTNYVAKGGITLPTTTVASKRLKLGFEWEADISKFNLIASAQES